MPTQLSLSDFSGNILGFISTPVISSIDYPSDDLAVSPAGNEEVTLIGSGFSSPLLYIDDVLTAITSSTDTQIVFNTPAKTAGYYTVKVLNNDGYIAFYPPGLQYSGFPTWVTSAGSIGTFYETADPSYQLSATSDSTVSYTLYSGSLPSGVTLSSSGLLSGSIAAHSSSTLYNFAVSAVDDENQNTERNFSLTVSPDSVSWSSPPPTTFNASPNSAITPITFTATSAGGLGITYTVDTLPAGLSLSGNTISGTPTTAQNVTSTITATSTSGKTVTAQIAFTIAVAVGQSLYSTPGTYTWTAPAGVTSVCVVCVGGGGGGHKYTSYARGGGGGGLGWKNNIAVTPGTGYTVVVGSGGAAMTTSATTTGAGAGGASYFINSSTVAGNGGAAGFYSTAAATRPAGGGYVGTGGGNGGAGGWGYAYAGGGGGAGGYAGDGGSGSLVTTNTYGTAGNAGTGGGGGGGGSGGSTKIAGHGGGVGVYGQGTNGAGGGAYTSSSYNGKCGTGGSGGGNGSSTYDNNTTAPSGTSGGGGYGGGGGGTDYSSGANPSGYGAGGAVRIIWGPGRSFPSTLTTDQ